MHLFSAMRLKEMLRSVAAGSISFVTSLVFAGPLSAENKSFIRSQYTPAILSIGFSDSEYVSAEQDSDYIALQLSLITSDDEPIGKNIRVPRESFLADLKSLYRQIARQDFLKEDVKNSPSRRLYDVFVRPISDDLNRQNISSILLALDPGLQAIPFSALHDGDRFFGDRYAIALTPSLRFTSLGPPSDAKGDVLAAGSSQFQYLAPLPLVPRELDGSGPVGSTNQFLDSSFGPDVLLQKAGDPRYSRVHIATHAEFKPGGPAQAVIHTRDKTVPLSSFSLLRPQRTSSPLDLFVLSACRTALGDPKSELGFAGLALQAGARSAMGSLWYVDDIATTALYLQFYRYLEQGIPKSESLQLARRAMITDAIKVQGDNLLAADGSLLIKNLSFAQKQVLRNGLSHPYFWSGIILVGTPW